MEINKFTFFYQAKFWNRIRLHNSMYLDPQHGVKTQGENHGAVGSAEQ